MTMIVLGIHDGHNASACLMIDGKLEAMAEEERFRRIKHWAGVPSEAISYCVAEAGIKPHEIEHIAFKKIILTLTLCQKEL